MFKFLKLLFVPCHLVFPYKLYFLLKKVGWVIYSAWVSHTFKSMNGIVKNGLTLHGGRYITIGKGSVIGRNATIEAWDCFLGEHFTPKINIGENVTIKDNVHITSVNSIVIEDGVLFGPNVLVSDNAHGTTTLDNLNISPVKRKLASHGGVLIKKNAWVGEKASILPGVTIGKGAIIGANSVVTKDVPDYGVAVGSPAKVVKIVNK